MGWYSDITLKVTYSDSTDPDEFKSWLTKNREELSTWVVIDFCEWMGVGNLKVTKDPSTQVEKKEIINDGSDTKEAKVSSNKPNKQVIITTKIKYGKGEQVRFLMYAVQEYFKNVTYIHGRVIGENGEVDDLRDYGDNVYIFDGNCIKSSCDLIPKDEIIDTNFLQSVNLM